MKALNFAYLILILLLAIIALSLFGCSTVKYIDREKITVDSSVVVQNEGLQQTLKETIERYEAERESWLTTGVLFDTIYRSDTVTVNKVTFDNGRIKTIEGRIRAVNTDLHERTAELYDAHITIDDLTMKLEKEESRLSKTQTITKIEKRKVLPWWLFMLFPAGLFVEYRFKIIQRLVKLIRYYANK